MKPFIIFDFNRTLYDPETASLLPGARDVLAALKEAGASLVLVSTAAENRLKLIRGLGIEGYFDEIRLVPRKTLALFKKLAKMGQDGARFVVGDRVRSEIMLGNKTGFETIWFRQGRFAEEEPEQPEEQPRHTVTSFQEIYRLIVR